MLRCDLHVHTTASDGVFPPEDVVFMARRAGLQVMAITDHDTIAGLPAARRAAEAAPGLRLIEGTEISAGVDREIHILGYGASLDHPLRSGIFCTDAGGTQGTCTSDAVPIERKWVFS